MLEIYAGKNALKTIQEQGFKQELFTDFLGGDIERLQKVHIDIMASLINYVNSDKNSSDIELGNLILDVIKNSEVREVD